MFSKINFTYKNPAYNNKNYLIQKKLQIQQKIKQNDTKSIHNSLDLKNKVNVNKLQETFIESKEEENTSKNIINNNIKIKLYDSSNINTNMVDKLFVPPVTSMEEGIVPFDVNRIRNKGIHTINNVYQSKYNYGKSHSTGLGDFIRGCYFVLEFCHKYKFIPKIIFNNCISNFLRIKTHKLELISNVLISIDFFKSNNFSAYNIQNGIILDPVRDTKNIMADFVEYTVNSPTYYGNVFMFCNSFPMDDIPYSFKQYMRQILEPIDEIKNNVREILTLLNFEEKKYNIIHVRSGDSYLKKQRNQFDNKYILKLVNAIRKDIQSNIDYNYLVIADNNFIKNILKNEFPNFKILIKDITHFGEGVVLEEEKVKNTIIDFYLLSLSNSINSYSSYEHGSGFSYWCAKTYEIPYVCKYIK
jgi:hypothetical protein